MSDTLLSIFNLLSDDSLSTYYQALYWYCTNNHEGQFSRLYSILSTLEYKPSLTEKAEDVNFDSLGFPVSYDNMLLLATALRLYDAVQHSEYEFVGLSYFAEKGLYIAEYVEYHDHDEEFDTYYMVYSVSASDTIINETLPE